MAGYESLNTYKVSGTIFRVPEQFNPVKVMGKGSYGIVIAAVNKNDTSKKVAIKRIKPMAEDEWDARHTLREIRIMRLLGDHPNIISLICVRALQEHNELYITMEFMDTDLHQIIRSKQSLTEQHYKYLMLQLVNGLRAMHHYDILHRDLKPGNLLVNKECQLRITDFGLSRYAARCNQDPDGKDGNAPKEKLTEYVVTRWYRCPELLLSPAQNYSCAVDMWSAGCIFAELMLRKPFMAGKNYVHQVQLILDMFGTPEEFGFELSDDAHAYMTSQPPRPPKDLAKEIPKASALSIDLLSKLLTYSPTERLSADEAATHPFFSDAPAVSGWSPKYQDAEQVGLGFDSQKLELDQLKELIFQEDRIMNGLIEDPGLRPSPEDTSTAMQDGGNTDIEGTQEASADPDATHLLRKPSRQYDVTEDEQTQHHLDQKKSQHNMSMQAMMAHQKALAQKAERPADVAEQTDNITAATPETTDEVYPVGDDLGALVEGNQGETAKSNPSGNELSSNMERVSIQPRQDEDVIRTQSLKDILKPYTQNQKQEDIPVTKQKLYEAIGDGRNLKTPSPKPGESHSNNNAPPDTS
mmetsp:Transcript_30179/g.39759  ORF Transcript_30179/g.39759 Transcript_30179/m.39759 type:complete len:582 (+) Transcript_30179:275-2020(+)|eukprot:CAMPEP_0117757674 /NCGR_PEP_ID=MMETSP0947-20121206/14881_1 /TAXON_ID=44440 /ORGANISM="Chattonella subsalsa, Strain CCMP2191" /LENGTH=581 /DNA_ID=CAMNT_0005577631 /DNA_START=204 /DNA_END=1949 /DNA_ORIENTATION=+